jgi:hypothetical protein
VTATEEQAPTARELIVTRELLMALGRSAAESIPPAPAARLRELDVLGDDGRPVEFAAPTADAVGRPLATLQLVAARPAGLAGADIWVGESRAVLHPRSAGEAPVVSVGRSLLPQLLLRATGLGPRPQSGAAAFVASAAQVADACRGETPPPWSGAAPVDRPQLWRLTWETVEGATGELAVLDLGGEGLWRPVSGEGDVLSWAPVSSATVWCRLGELFALVLSDRIPT